jgi:uncharacterized protein (TIRG00374 family)
LKKKLLTALKVLVFLSLGLFLVWFALRGINDEQREAAKAAFRDANYSWVILSILLGILSHISRAMRWKLMLETLGYNPKLSNTFFAVLIGYMANYAPIPRLGEASRCGILTQYEKIPFTESFGSVIAERLIDVLCLLVVFVITFLVQFNTINDLAHQYVINPMTTKFAFIGLHPVLTVVAILACIAAFVLFLKMRNKAGTGLVSKVLGILSGFLEGLKTVKNIKNPVQFIGHTVFIWLMYYVSMHVCFYALAETSHLGFKEGICVFALGTLGVVFTPGGLGAYHVIVQKALMLFAISAPIAFAFPWIVWSASFFLIIVLGLTSFILLPLLNKDYDPATPDIS